MSSEEKELPCFGKGQKQFGIEYVSNLEGSVSVMNSMQTGKVNEVYDSVLVRITSVINSGHSKGPSQSV